MSENIRTVNLIDNAVITDRDILVDTVIHSIDINQSDGTYAVVEPLAIDGSYNGRVIIYPQSPLPQVSSLIELKTFNRVGSLYYPLDAKFDYLRRKIWIADTGNNRILKVNLNTNQVDLSIDENIIYPHALSVELNTGDIFIKGYSSYDLSYGSIFYYKKDGTLLSTFCFNREDILASSSSSSFEGTISSSSSSVIVFPVFPSSRSMSYDHVRSRLWWVDGIRIYVADIRNKQIQTYDIRDNFLSDTISINIEFSTGNAFVVATDIHNDRFLIQVNRDCNRVLGVAYIEG